MGQVASDHTELDRRQVEEPRAKRRSEAQRDRDRILYSSAFQRLAGITQVSSPQPGLHNRLTHSLKVAQVARRIAEAWRHDPELQEAFGGLTTVQNLNPDAVEASGLAHDLGHPPFGHVAEYVLADCARGYEGFEGNAQSFRIVNYLATGTAAETNYRGLNLTRRTLNGILKYPWLREGGGTRAKKYGSYHAEEAAFEFAREGFPIGTRSTSRAALAQRSLEAELTDWADDVTYAVHDLEDFYRAGFIDVDRLVRQPKESKAFLEACDRQRAPGGRLEKFDESQIGAAFENLQRELAPLEAFDDSLLMRATLRTITSRLIGRYVEAIRPVDPKNVTAHSLDLVSIDQEARNEVAVLKEMTWYGVIENPKLGFIQSVHRDIMRRLFDHFLGVTRTRREWSALPIRQQEELELGPGDGGGEEAEQMRARIVLDFVAGLTEAQAYEYYRALTGAERAGILGPVEEGLKGSQ
jgi:dGTPase